MGTPDSYQQAWEILHDEPALTNQMRSVACEALYPGTIGPSEIALLLEKPGLREEHFGRLQHAVQRLLEERLTPEHAGALIRELNRLVQLATALGCRTRRRGFLHDSSFFSTFCLWCWPSCCPGPLTEATYGPAAESLSLLAESHPFHRQHNEAYRVARRHDIGPSRVFGSFSSGRPWSAGAAHPNDQNHFLAMYEFRQVLKLSEADLDLDDPGHQYPNRPHR